MTSASTAEPRLATAPAHGRVFCPALAMLFPVQALLIGRGKRGLVLYTPDPTIGF